MVFIYGAFDTYCMGWHICICCLVAILALRIFTLAMEAFLLRYTGVLAVEFSLRLILILRFELIGIVIFYVQIICIINV